MWLNMTKCWVFPDCFDFPRNFLEFSKFFPIFLLFQVFPDCCEPCTTLHIKMPIKESKSKILRERSKYLKKVSSRVWGPQSVFHVLQTWKKIATLFYEEHFLILTWDVPWLFVTGAELGESPLANFFWKHCFLLFKR